MIGLRKQNPTKRTKYDLLYGVGVEHFPNERENVKEKLRLATMRRNELYMQPYSEQREIDMFEVNQAITWAEKILRDIDD